MSLTPVAVSTGIIPRPVPTALSVIPKILGIDGPVMSASSIAACPAAHGEHRQHRGHHRFADAALAADNRDYFLIFESLFAGASRLSALRSALFWRRSGSRACRYHSFFFSGLFPKIFPVVVHLYHVVVVLKVLEQKVHFPYFFLILKPDIS